MGQLSLAVTFCLLTFRFLGPFPVSPIDFPLRFLCLSVFLPLARFLLFPCFPLSRLTSCARVRSCARLLCPPRCRQRVAHVQGALLLLRRAGLQGTKVKPFAHLILTGCMAQEKSELSIRHIKQKSKLPKKTKPQVPKCPNFPKKV